MKKYLFIVWSLIFVTMGVLNANASVIDFDALSDSDVVTNQFSGLTFSNAIVLTSGISLNEYEFPPYSGSNVISDDGGPITITFTNLMADVGAYFTYLTALDLSFYDNLDAVVGTASSVYSANMALSGDTGSLPNEYLHLNWNAGISKLVITGDLAGYSFTMDDLTMTPVTNSAPEPATIILLLCGLMGIAIKKRLA